MSPHFDAASSCEIRLVRGGLAGDCWPLQLFSLRRRLGAFLAPGFSRNACQLATPSILDRRDAALTAPTRAARYCPRLASPHWRRALAPGRSVPRAWGRRSAAIFLLSTEGRRGREELCHT